MSCWTRILWCTVSNLKDCETQSSNFLISVWMCWPMCLSEWDQRADTQKAVHKAKQVSWSEKSWILTSSISSACRKQSALSNSVALLDYVSWGVKLHFSTELRTNLRDLYLRVFFVFFLFLLLQTAIYLSSYSTALAILLILSNNAYLSK